MSYSSMDASAGYYASSQDRRYPTASSAAIPSNGYTSTQPYNHSVPPSYPPHDSRYAPSSAMTPGAYSAYTSSSGPSRIQSPPPTSRSQPTNIYGGPAAYPSYHSHYDTQRSASYSSTSSGSSFAASPPTSPAYPASPARPYQCDQCVLSFDRSHDLKRHRDSHSGAKPFICTSCNKSFTRKDALKRHQSQKQCGTETA
ncbi:hypothetical protein M422DRAFT_205060 [Sphaerobolus stellatus SS14]|nr:hypothetical protein M422DRAFT_205060 [Sphaerobolus stellatus SS14]